jgi:hypothetical protein
MHAEGEFQHSQGLSASTDFPGRLARARRIRMQIRKLVMVSLIMALGLSCMPANAQTMVRGSFDLPAAVYCGNAVLQPGHYNIWFLHDGAPVQDIHLRGAGAHLSLPAVVRPGGNPAHSYINLAETGGSYFIRSLNAGSAGKSLVFGVSKKLQREARSAHPKLAGIVPVSITTGGF